MPTFHSAVLIDDLMRTTWNTSCQGCCGSNEDQLHGGITAHRRPMALTNPGFRSARGRPRLTPPGAIACHGYRRSFNALESVSGDSAICSSKAGGQRICCRESKAADSLRRMPALHAFFCPQFFCLSACFLKLEMLFHSNAWIHTFGMHKRSSALISGSMTTYLLSRHASGMLRLVRQVHVAADSLGTIRKWN